MKISVAENAFGQPCLREVANLKELFHSIAPDSGEVIIECKAPPEPMTKEYENYIIERKKAVPLFFPVVFNDTGRKREQDIISGSRFLAVDCDDLSEGDEDKLADKLASAGTGGHAVGMYTSFKHTDKAPRVRFIVGLDREATPAEIPALWRALNTILGNKVDGQTKDVTRGYFVWSRPSWREPGKNFFDDGKDFSVDWLLGMAGAKAETSVSPAPTRKVETVEEFIEGPRVLYREDYEVLLADKRNGKSEFAANVTAFLTAGMAGEAWGDASNRNSRVIHAMYAIVDKFATKYKETSINLQGSLEFFSRSCAAVQEQNGASKYSVDFLVKTARDRLSIVAEKHALRPKEFPMTDAGNGERVADRYTGRLNYVDKWKSWMAWDGKRWNKDSADALVYRAVKDTARYLQSAAATLGNDDPEYADMIRKWGTRCESNAMVKSTLYAAQREMSTDHTKFDTHHMLLNVRNGTLDLNTGKLLDHNPEHMITRLSAVDYRPSAVCPKWQKFVSEVMAGDEEMVRYLQRYLGYCLTGIVQEEALLFALGRGGNGKSVLFNTIAHILGEYAVKCPIDMLLSKKNDGHPTELTILHGARYALASETEQNKAWAVAKVKELTGGDPISARRLYENLWEWNPTHKFVVMTNHEPRVTGSDDGIWRRMKKVPFDISFIGNPNKTLSMQLREEWPGILNWLVEGCSAWQREGLREPAKVTAATDAYRKEEDTIGMFLDECCELVPEARTTKRPIRDAYVRWCQDEGYEPIGAKLLAKELKSHGIAQETYGSHRWVGIKLSPNKADKVSTNTKTN